MRTEIKNHKNQIIGFVKEDGHYYQLETPEEEFVYTTFQECEEKAEEIYKETGKTF